MTRTEFGFDRTVCDCHHCRQPCMHMPGYLIPDDLERMAVAMEYTNSLEFAREWLWASPGPLVGNTATGRAARIPTIVPARQDNGRCIFFMESGLCKVHAAAPAGCAFFDMHQSAGEAERRSLTFLKAVARAGAKGEPYSAVWHVLARTGRKAPPPESTRHRFDRGVQPRPG